MHKKMPIGFIELENGPKAIFVMNDFFLNFTFQKKENWESLRTIVNTLLDAYKKAVPFTGIELIEGELTVETQYKYYIGINKTRRQDIKILDITSSKVSFIEFHNKASTIPPIETRAVEYFILGIRQNSGKTANQVWLLAEDVEAVLHSEKFAHYILTDEVTGKLYPSASGIMFISLKKLSEEKSEAGELASYLLGKIKTPKYKKIKNISALFNASLNAFKNDKEVKKMMSVAETYLMEGRAEGVAQGVAQGMAEGMARGKVQGIAEGIDKVLKLINQGISPEEALQMVKNSTQTHPTTTS